MKIGQTENVILIVRAHAVITECNVIGETQLNSTENYGRSPVSMPRGPGAGPALADMTAPSRAASAGPAVEWKMVQLWPTVDGPLLASLHVAIIC